MYHIKFRSLTFNLHFENGIQTFYFNYYMLIPIQIPFKNYFQSQYGERKCTHTIAFVCVWHCIGSELMNRKTKRLILIVCCRHTCLDFELFLHCLLCAYFLISFGIGTCLGANETWYFWFDHWVNRGICISFHIISCYWNICTCAMLCWTKEICVCFFFIIFPL